MSILRNVRVPHTPLPPLNQVFYASEQVDCEVESKDSHGNILSKSLQTQVVRHAIDPVQMVSDVDAELSSVKCMLETGMNQDMVTRPYFTRSLDEAPVLFDRLAEIPSQSDEEVTSKSDSSDSTSSDSSSNS